MAVSPSSTSAVGINHLLLIQPCTGLGETVNRAFTTKDNNCGLVSEPPLGATADRHGPVTHPVCLENSGDLRDERVVGVRITKERADRQQHCKENKVSTLR